MDEMWGWALDEDMHGPFHSREEAEDDCIFTVTDERDEGTEITPAILKDYRVFECEKVDPPRWVAARDHQWLAEEIIERADETLNDTACFDEAVFDLAPGAADALKAALQAWAREYVTTSGQWHMKQGAKYLPVRLPEPAPSLTGPIERPEPA